MTRASSITRFAVLLAVSALMMTSAQAEDKVLSVGYSSDAGPFSYQDEAGNPAGYSVEICREVIQDMQDGGRLTVEFIALSDAQRDFALQEQKVDLLCGADNVTLKRRESVSFSIPIFVDGISAALRTDAPSRLRTLMDGEDPRFRPGWRASLSQILKQRTFLVVEGSKAQNWLPAAMDDFDIIIETKIVPDFNQGIMLIDDRKADVIFASRSLLLDAAEHGRYADSIYVVDRFFTLEPIALTMRRGDDDLRLAADRTISRLYSSGEIYEIYEKFFGEPGEEIDLLFRLGALDE